MNINNDKIRTLKRGESGCEFVYIYTLTDPLTNLIKYVGKTDNIKRRLDEHIRKSKYTKTHKNNWINKLIKNGQKPLIEIIDIVNNNDWGFWEIFWIDQIKSWNFNLTNTAIGGTGGNLGYKVNKKISEALKGKKHTEETKEKMSKAKIGGKHSEETILKFKENNKGDKNPMFGKKHTKETKEKIGAKSKINNKGDKNPMFEKKHTKETKEKIKYKLSELNCGENNPFYGKKHTEEVKSKKRIKVKQLDLNGNLVKIWDSISEAATTLNISQSGISNVCDKENKTYKNFKWVKLKNN